MFSVAERKFFLQNGCTNANIVKYKNTALRGTENPTTTQRGRWFHSMSTLMKTRKWTRVATRHTATCLVSPLSARVVVWCFIHSNGLSANHLNWLTFIRLCVRARYFVFWRASAHMSINRKSKSKRGRKEAAEISVYCWSPLQWIHFS